MKFNERDLVAVCVGFDRFRFRLVGFRPGISGCGLSLYLAPCCEFTGTGITNNNSTRQLSCPVDQLIGSRPGHTKSSGRIPHRGKLTVDFDCLCHLLHYKPTNKLERCGLCGAGAPPARFCFGCGADAHSTIRFFPRPDTRGCPILTSRFLFLRR